MSNSDITQETFFRADMHCHSVFSDGTLTPNELVDLAVDKGLRGLSITDHDTFAGYTRELFTYAHEKGIVLVPGIEFSTFYKDTGVHILAYDFLLENQALKEFCDEHKKRREMRNLAILEKLRGKGIVLDVKDLLESTVRVVGRVHIAALMVKKGYVKNLKEAFDQYIGDAKSCYIRGKSFSVEETIEMVHRAGGKVSLAHPLLLSHYKLLLELLERPFDGVEAYYARMPLHRVQKILKIAKRKKLSLSGGSDFHGAHTPHVTLGTSFVTQTDFSYWNQNYVQSSSSESSPTSINI